MNIEIIFDHIRQFDSEIIDSGLKRDVKDFLTSLPSNQNNIVALREIAADVSEQLNNIYSGDLPDSLSQLFPKTSPRPFTETNFPENLTKLINNTEIDQNQFFSQLQQILTKLNQILEENKNEIDKIRNFIDPYIKKDKIKITEKDEAILSIVFKDKKTITNLKEFTKNIDAWNRILPVYHQVLSSKSPKDIEIVEVQNSSIDIVVNFNIDIALNLIDLFKVGFECYAAYLAYKKIIIPITSTYRGNQKLIQGEKTREKELLNNIPEAILNEIISQNKSALKSDKNIDKNIDKKVEIITNLITSHIVKGNDIKLLAVPKGENESDEMSALTLEIIKALQSKSKEVRSALKKLPSQELHKLLKTYGEIQEDIPK